MFLIVSVYIYENFCTISLLVWRDERVGELCVKSSNVNILENRMERSVIYQRDLLVLNTADVGDRYIDKIGRCCWQLHPTEDNINKVITRMSPCPAGVEHSRCCWQFHLAEDNINKVIIGISPWPMDVVKLGKWWQIRPPIEVSLGV